MANVASQRSFFPLRVSQYVPGMRYSSDVNWAGKTRIDFGTPLAANPTALASALAIPTSGTSIVDMTGTTPSDVLFGRNLTMVGSGAGFNTVVSAFGWDYLGQPMQEDLTGNGVTPVLGKKAFYALRSLTINGVAGGLTLNMGWGGLLGLPYKAVRCAYETNNQALVAAGTLTAPVLTDPQTSVTGDPRGTYSPTSTMNGGNAITAAFDMQNDVNVNNRGGLFGIAHYTS